MDVDALSENSHPPLDYKEAAASEQKILDLLKQALDGSSAPVLGGGSVAHHLSKMMSHMAKHSKYADTSSSDAGSDTGGDTGAVRQSAMEAGQSGDGQCAETKVLPQAELRQVGEMMLKTAVKLLGKDAARRIVEGEEAEDATAAGFDDDREIAETNLTTENRTQSEKPPKIILPEERLSRLPLSPPRDASGSTLSPKPERALGSSERLASLRSPSPDATVDASPGQRGSLMGPSRPSRGPSGGPGSSRREDATLTGSKKISNAGSDPTEIRRRLREEGERIYREHMEEDTSEQRKSQINSRALSRFQ